MNLFVICATRVSVSCDRWVDERSKLTSPTVEPKNEFGEKGKKHRRDTMKMMNRQEDKEKR